MLMRRSHLIVVAALVAASAVMIEEAFAQTTEQTDMMWAFAAPWIAQSFAFGSIIMWVVIGGVVIAVGAYVLTYVSRWVASSGLNQTSLLERIKGLGAKGKTESTAQGKAASE